MPTTEKKRGGGRRVAYDCIGTGVCGPFVERIHAVFSRSVLIDEVLINRLRVHPFAEPCGGECMERDIYGCSVLKGNKWRSLDGLPNL